MCLREVCRGRLSDGESKSNRVRCSRIIEIVWSSSTICFLKAMLKSVFEIRLQHFSSMNLVSKVVSRNVAFDRTYKP